MYKRQDDQPTVYLRWVMGETDGGWRYCGWNIDDVEIYAYDEVFQPIELASFEAVYADSTGSVHLTWVTLSEIDIVGYNLYRSVTDDFATASQINTSIIPGHAPTTTPHTYDFNDETASITTQYYYWLQALGFGGYNEIYGSFIYVPNVSNDDEPTTQLLSLHNYPNPFRQKTEISYSITKPEQVRIQIYNLKGQLVETIVDGYIPAGDYRHVWNAENATSGIYFIKFKSKGVREVQKVILIK